MEKLKSNSCGVFFLLFLVLSFIPLVSAFSFDDITSVLISDGQKIKDSFNLGVFYSGGVSSGCIYSYSFVYHVCQGCSYTRRAGSDEQLKFNLVWDSTGKDVGISGIIRQGDSHTFGGSSWDKFNVEWEVYDCSVLPSVENDDGCDMFGDNAVCKYSCSSGETDLTTTNGDDLCAGSRRCCTTIESFEDEYSDFECFSNADCSGDKPFCKLHDVGLVCVECRGHSDCSDDKPVCFTNFETPAYCGNYNDDGCLIPLMIPFTDGYCLLTDEDWEGLKWWFWAIVIAILILIFSPLIIRLIRSFF